MIFYKVLAKGEYIKELKQYKGKEHLHILSIFSSDSRIFG